MFKFSIAMIIVAASVLLFTHWCCYPCLLIVDDKTAGDYASELTSANQFSFLQVQTSLRGATSREPRSRK